MASPQVEDGYTKIANEILEALSRMKISEHEVRILFFLIRKTYGWRKKNDWISLSQFSKGCGIDRRNAHKAIKRLLSKNLVVICRDDIKHPTYGFQKDYEKWLSYVDMTTLADKFREKKERKSVRTYDRVVYVGTPTKETITKETLKERKKRDGANPSSLSSESQNLKPETRNPSSKENPNPNPNPRIESIARNLEIPKNDNHFHSWLVREQSSFLKEHGLEVFEKTDWVRYSKHYYPGLRR